MTEPTNCEHWTQCMSKPHHCRDCIHNPHIDWVHNLWRSTNK